MTASIIAIDGPAGSGKSSVSKEVARRLGFGYVDTGAAYRAATWWVLANAIDPTDVDAVAGSLATLNLGFVADPDAFAVTVGTDDVTEAIREPRVTAAVSAVSRVPEVRAHLNASFHHAVTVSDKAGVVVEGRDITTVVMPEAPLRVLLTADEATRMERRGLELPSQSTSDLTRQIRDRDVADSQVSDFMSAADGVITVDSTHLDFQQTVDAVLAEAARVGLTS